MCIRRIFFAVPEQDAKRMLAELRDKYTVRIRKIESIEKTMKAKTDQCAVITREIENVNRKSVTADHDLINNALRIRLFLVWSG